MRTLTSLCCVILLGAQATQPASLPAKRVTTPRQLLEQVPRSKYPSDSEKWNEARIRIISDWLHVNTPGWLFEGELTFREAIIERDYSTCCVDFQAFRFRNREVVAEYMIQFPRTFDEKLASLKPRQRIRVTATITEASLAPNGKAGPDAPHLLLQMTGKDIR